MTQTMGERRLGRHAPLAVAETPVEHRTGKAAHSHPEGQLAMVDDGVLVVDIEGRNGLVPARRIAWVPAGMIHSAVTYGVTRGWTFHLEPKLCDRLPPTPTVFRTTDLTTALFERIAGWETGEVALSGQQDRLLHVFLEELATSEAEAIFLPIPKDERLRRMAAAVLVDPSNRDDLATWAVRIGMSERTLTRRFRTETNMSYVQWRSMARMQRALEMLSAGASVTDTALDLGYDSVSSFIAKFRATFGVTPSRSNRTTTDVAVRCDGASPSVSPYQTRPDGTG